MKPVSIIIPIIREDKAERCIEAIKAGAGSAVYEIVTGVDTEKDGCPVMIDRLVERTHFNQVMFLGDDTIPEPGFLQAASDAMGTLPDKWGVVGLATEGGNDAAHWLADKRILRHIEGGKFAPLAYAHCWWDNELQDIAREQDRWTFAEDAKVKHDHPINNDNKGWDDGYIRAYSYDHQKKDLDTYIRRTRIRRRQAQAEKHDGVRLAICFPLTDLKVYSHFMFSFLKLKIPYTYDLLFPNFPGQIDAIRNDLVRQALTLGCTHILMLDTDQIYEDENMIPTLINHDLPVVGVKVHRRYEPYDPILLRGEVGAFIGVPDDEIKAGGLIKVDATGCGCLMINTEILLDMPEPWFELKTGDIGQPIGEDISFCMQLKERGIDVMVDCDINILHLMTWAVGWNQYQIYKAIIKKHDEQQKKESKNGD